MIEKEIIKAIKEECDLGEYIESRGIKLTKQGKNRLCLCPFHNDKTPSLSINTEENLWQCFGCGAGGDIIRFVELFDKLGFREAVSKLSGLKFTCKPGRKAPAKQKAVKEKKELTVKQKKLLGRVISYYQHTFAEDLKGMNYLKNERGIRENSSLTDFGVGYANGTLLDILPDDDEIIDSLKAIGILNKRGKEAFYKCVVFPLCEPDGTVINLYGRNIDKNNKITHLYLPGPKCGLATPAYSVAKRTQTVILTESIIDALTLYDQGFKNVVPAYGVNGLTEDHLSFFNRKIKEVYIVFDADDPGRKAAEATKEQLKKKEILSHIVTLPDKDVNIYFKRHTPEEFEGLLKEANPGSLERSESVSKREQTFYKESEHGFAVRYGKREYQIKGIRLGNTQLKATIKASLDMEGNTPFELTTIDLYSSRSRSFFAKLCVSLFGASEALVREDIGKLLDLVENYTPKEKTIVKNEPTQEEQEAAMLFLKNPDMFAEILADLESAGITGEETNKLIGYLAAVSRKLEDPLSVLIQSRSAAGKSTLQDAILSLVPEEDYVKYTRITDQALFYKEEDALINKILAIEEADGMGGAAYSIRNIQSSKKITVAATGKDPGTGRMKTEEYTVKGPVSVMLTTTAAELEGETASRFLFLTVDESKQMTEAIHEKQREAETLEGIISHKRSEIAIKKHHTAQRLLRPMAVANPYSKYLTYPSRSIRTRRDHKKYLGLIRVTTFLHQYQREIKTAQVDGNTVEYIEVTFDDIEMANKLANQVLGLSLDELAPPSRTLLSGIFEMVKKSAEEQNESVDEVYFTRRMVREHLGWTDWQIRSHINQLEELEYLHARTGSKGKEYAYALNYREQDEETGRCRLNLTTVEEIKKRLKKKEDES